MTANTSRKRTSLCVLPRAPFKHAIYLSPQVAHFQPMRDQWGIEQGVERPQEGERLPEIDRSKPKDPRNDSIVGPEEYGRWGKDVE